MNNQLSWDEHSSRKAPPGGAHSQAGVSHSTAPVQHQAPTDDSKASDGGAIETLGVAQANGESSTDNQVTETPWPPPGVALADVYTTDEARLYLYDKHDVFLKERHVQKLVKDFGKLIGKRVPKAGGGSVVEITKPSLDQYVRDNPQRQNAKDTPLDPNDKLFEQFRNIAARKGYRIMIEGVAPTKTETPSPAPEPPAADPAPAAQEKPTTKPNAQTSESDARASVPAELYNQLKDYAGRLEQRVTTLEKTTNQLYETLDSTYDKMLDQNQKILELSAKAIEMNEKPSTVIKNMVDAVRAARGEDDVQRIPVHPTPGATIQDQQQASQSNFHSEYRDDPNAHHNAA